MYAMTPLWIVFLGLTQRTSDKYNFGKIGQSPIGDDRIELRLPTSHNQSVLTTVAGHGVRGSDREERAPTA